ncbi:MAG: radical SAM protein [bacterium]
MGDSSKLLGRAWARLIADPRWRRLVTSETYQDLREFVTLPAWEGYTLTPRRLANLYLLRLEHRLGRTQLRSRPVKLTVEATNICNLRCPGCFTGVGEVGRARSHMSLDFYRTLLDELSPTLLELEFYNWGEPLLAKHLTAMIADASARGISTTVSTNFSLPFDAERAERLVSSGLTVLGVSLDGARQETYAQYRVRGDFDLVLKNCALVRDAKRRLGQTRPRVVWEFHVFPHNVGDIAQARAMAADLEMDIAVTQGWMIGGDWDGGGAIEPQIPQPYRCPFLWGVAVVNNDGGVAPCCGTFYQDDDCGKLATAAGDSGAHDFAGLWNTAQFARKRRFFRARSGNDEERQDVCFECPTTRLYEDFQRHRAAGGGRADYHVPISMNDAPTYFRQRRPPAAATLPRRSA